MRRELGVPRLGLGFRAWDRYALRSADRAPQRWVGVPAGAPRAEAINASASARTKRDQTLRPGSNGRSDQLQPQDRCPMAEGPTSNSNRRTGPGTKGFINSVDPARAACGELGQIRSGSIPSWETLPESESSVRSDPGNRDRAPRFLWSETLVKPNNAVIVAAAAARRRGLPAPPTATSPKCSHKVDTRPATPRHRPRVRTLPGPRAGASRRRSAFRVSSRAFRRQLTCPFRSKPRSGNRAGGSVIPCSSSNASSNARNRSSVTSHVSPFPLSGWVSFRFLPFLNQRPGIAEHILVVLVRLQGHQLGVLPPQLRHPLCLRD